MGWCRFFLAIFAAPMSGPPASTLQVLSRFCVSLELWAGALFPISFCCPALLVCLLGSLGWRHLFLSMFDGCTYSLAFWASDPFFPFFCVLLRVFLAFWAGFPVLLLVAPFLRCFSLFFFVLPLLLLPLLLLLSSFSSSGGRLGPPRGRFASCPTSSPAPLQSRVQLALSVPALLLAHAFQACAGLGGSGVPGVGLGEISGGSLRDGRVCAGFVCVGLCPCCPVSLFLYFAILGCICLVFRWNRSRRGAMMLMEAP